MKRSIFSIVAVCLLLVGTLTSAAAPSFQSFCFQADTGEVFITVAGDGTGQIVNCGNPNLPFDSLTLTGTMTISKCSLNYQGTLRAFSVNVTGDTCTGIASIQVFKGKSLINSSTDSDMSDSICTCQQ